VIPSQVTILADTAERAENLDEAAALHAQDEAKRLLDEQQSEFEYKAAGCILLSQKSYTILRVSRYSAT